MKKKSKSKSKSKTNIVKAKPVSENTAGKRPFYKNFCHALLEIKDPHEVIRKFNNLDINIGVESIHRHGSIGSLKIGRFIENKIFFGADSVTLTKGEIVALYGISADRIP